MHPVAGTGRLLAGRYRLQTQVGRGAMGIVWHGRDELLDRSVAVKEIRTTPTVTALTAATASGYAAGPGDSYQRALREARTAARLSHPGVAQVFDVVEEDGAPWIVMELVTARSLDQVIAEDGPLPPSAAARVGTGLLSALASAHAAGVLHRDVKPSNVLITADGRPVLTDFGIAEFAGDPAITSAGLVAGTPGFTAPERMRGRPASPASDLWSLGATLYAAVEGRGPFDRLGSAATITALAASAEAPQAPSAGPLGPVIVALLQADPALRPDAETAARLLAGAADAGEPAIMTAPVFAELKMPAVPPPSGTAVSGLAPPARAGGSATQASRTAGHAATGRPTAGGTTAGSAIAGGTTAGLAGARSAAAARRAVPWPRRRSRPVRRLVAVAGALAFLAVGITGWSVFSRSLGLTPAPATAAAAGGTVNRGGRLHQDRPGNTGLQPAVMPAGGQGSATGPSGGGTAAGTGRLRAVPRRAATKSPAAARAGVRPANSGGTAGGGTRRRTAPSPSPSPSATGPGSGGTGPAGGPAAPPGYQWFSLTGSSAGAVAGFTLAAPDSWQLTRNGLSLYLAPPAGGAYLEVNLAAFTHPYPVGEARYQEAQAIAQDSYPGYRRLLLRPAGFRNAPAASWRFRWHQHGAGRTDVAELLFTLQGPAGLQSYAVSVSAPAAGFGAADTVFRTALATFRRTA